jgi:alpha-methylacyl-CoA racemase
MGPLQGVTVIEIASQGPGPFCAMILADLGASVIRVDRADAVMGGDPGSPPPQPLVRGRRSVGVDLKNPGGSGVVLKMAEAADVLMEGFRPGVAERLGMGPDECLARNPGLVYGRATGWGQTGPQASDAGHDINFVAVSGALHAIGRKGGAPVLPLNLVADFGGGGMLLAVGVLAALLERDRSGRGQVVDAAMVDGSALLMTMFHGLLAEGLWTDERGVNLFDGGAPFYDVYETSDGGFMAVGAIEPQFFARLVELLGIEPSEAPDHMDRSRWPELRSLLERRFLTRTRDDWAEIFRGEDACVTPVLSMIEAAAYPHHRERGMFVEVGGMVQPSPAPRFSRSLPETPTPPPHAGQHTGEVLAELGFDSAEIERLRASGAVR